MATAPQSQPLVNRRRVKKNGHVLGTRIEGMEELEKCESHEGHCSREAQAFALGPMHHRKTLTFNSNLIDLDT
jgi:hypothetical protein